VAERVVYELFSRPACRSYLRAVLPHARRHVLSLTSTTITPVGRQSDPLAFYSINSNIYLYSIKR